MADNGGLKVSFFAYRKEVGEFGGKQKSKMMPNLTNDQLFFFSFAQSWCFKGTDEYERFWVENNSHSYPPFRVEGSLSNFNEFANAFGCKATDRYSRPEEERCDNW